MTREKLVGEWRKRRRQSVRALPVVVALLAAVSGLLFVVSRFVSVPTWLAAVAVGMVVLSLLGDVINIVYLGYKLRQATEPGE